MNRVLLTAFSLVALFTAPLSAQIGHYWGSQFGNESVLLNGAVIGSVTDLGAVYYNPARLLHLQSPAFVVSAKLYERTTVRVNDGLGEGENLSQTSFGGAPGFLGGTFTIPFLEKHQFAYGLLTRDRGRVSYFLREVRSGDLIDFLPGQDDFVGFISYDNDFKDDWMGLAWAYPLSERWSLGATAFYYNRSFSQTVDLDLRAIGDTGEAATIQVERAYRVNDQGILGKLGIAWSGESFSWGATATTPYWRVKGDGSVRFENFQVGVPGADGVTDDNILESTVQTGLPMAWKTPWSVGTGVGWTLGRWILHGATEYFSAVPAHTVIRADPVPGQSTDEPIDFAVVEERKAVINGGVGVRWTRSETFSAFASVATNFSAAPDSVVRFTDLDAVTNHTSLQMDFLLLGGGASFHTRWADLTLGATWQGSSQPARRILNLPEEGEEPDEGLAKIIIQQWRFLFGFSLPFGQGDEDDGEDAPGPSH